jgi:hypothetical protein
VALVV